jgi:hypothetical protein
MLTVHHLGRSQSSASSGCAKSWGSSMSSSATTAIRQLGWRRRSSKHYTRWGPLPSSDGELVLAESGAIVDYIIARYGVDVSCYLQRIRTTCNTSTGSISPTATCKRFCTAT